VPGAVPEAVRQGRLEVAASWELAEEIVEVLRRPRLGRYGIIERDVEDASEIICRSLAPTVW